MKKVLMVASVASMIDQFNMSNIGILKKMGYEVHVAANFESGNTSSKQRVETFKQELQGRNIPFFQINFSRSIADIRSNLNAFQQLKELLLEHKYQFLHCHSPIGGVCARIAGHQTQTPVIYTAHGFHFYRGGPIQNWLFYYPVERYLSKYTDVLITINKEDYRLAQSMNAKKTSYIPGVGVNTAKFDRPDFNRKQKREELGIANDSVVLLSVGELIKRKNHETVINALANIRDKDFVYLICGRGELEAPLNALAHSLGLENKVKLLGFRTDISEICLAADTFVFPSHQEGLPVALMEAMAAGLPIVCSSIRGNTDLLEDEKGGYLVPPLDVQGFARSIDDLLQQPELRWNMGQWNRKEIQKYDVKIIEQDMFQLYKALG